MTPPPRKVSFSALDPAPEAPGIASETTEIGGNRWARVRYEPDVLREEWCDEGHEGFVLEGDITYEFEDGTESLQLVARAARRSRCPGAARAPRLPPVASVRALPRVVVRSPSSRG